MKPEVIIPGVLLGTLVLLCAMVVGYHLYTNAKNRELYAECLRVSERMSANKNREGNAVQIVSTPTCYLR